MVYNTIMGTHKSNQPVNTEDEQFERLVFIYDTLKETLKTQEDDYNSQLTKTTTVFGFITALSGAYLQWATNVNAFGKGLGLFFWGLSLIFLCLAYRNREFFRPALPDTDITLTKIQAKQQDVADIQAACENNYAALNDIGAYVNRAIFAFAAGIIAFGFSFIG